MNCASSSPAPSYASVLVGDLEEKVSALERGPLVPCITAWCSTCRRAHLLTSSAHMFPCLSAHHAHMVVLAERIKEM